MPAEVLDLPRDRRGGPPAAELPAPDLEIRVRLLAGHAGGAGPRLGFEVTACDPDLELMARELGSVSLEGDPRIYFERFFDLAAFPDSNPGEQIAVLCSELGRELLPPGLGRLLIGLEGRVETVWIRSEELWIPWEILAPCGRRDGRAVTGRFLCETFSPVRWRPGAAAPGRLPVRRLAAVLGVDPQLPSLGEERRFLDALRGDGREVEILPPEPQAVLAAMEGGRFDAWHFAGHGSWQSDDPGAAKIGLSADAGLTLREIEHHAPNFCASRPLVFLNACHLGRGERGLVHWGGWAARLVETGAGAVIGALWPIGDGAALEFARGFYGDFLDGRPLAEAVRRGRERVRRHDPGGADWLAFTAWGHPRTVCAAPPEGLPAAPRAACGEPPPGGREPPHPLRAVRSMAAVTEPAAGGARDVGSPAARAARRLALAILALAVASFGPLVAIRPATPVELELVTERLAVHLTGSRPQAATEEDLPLTGVTFSRFSRVEMHPAELALADASDSMHPLAAAQRPVALIAREPAARVAIEPAAAGSVRDAGAGPPVATGSAGPVVATLDRLWLAPGTMFALDASSLADALELGIEIDPAPSLDLPIYGEFDLSAERAGTNLTGAVGAAAAARPVLRLRGSLEPGRPLLQVHPGADGLTIAARLAAGSASRPLLESAVAVDMVEFDVQNGGGSRVSSLVAPGAIRYPDHPWVEPLAVAAGDEVVLGELRDFRLRSIGPSPSGRGLAVRMEGTAGRLESGPPGAVRDRRLSLYRRWILGDPWRWLVGWLAGAAGLAWTVERVWRRPRER